MLIIGIMTGCFLLIVLICVLGEGYEYIKELREGNKALRRELKKYEWEPTVYELECGFNRRECELTHLPGDCPLCGAQ